MTSQQLHHSLCAVPDGCGDALVGHGSLGHEHGSELRLALLRHLMDDGAVHGAQAVGAYQARVSSRQHPALCTEVGV